MRTYRTTFLATFIPMTYLAAKCTLLLFIQRKRLKNRVSINPNPQQRKNIGGANQLHHPKQSKLTTIVVNMIVICVSLFYLILGFGFSIFVFLHFSESQEQCLNPNLNTKILYPELYLWNECKYKTFPFKSINFWNDNNDDEINCNCRQAEINLSVFDDSFNILEKTNNSEYENKFYEMYNKSIGCSESNLNHVCLMIESLLINWDMLEILYISDDSARFTISLNDSKHYNSEYLKILHLNEIKVNSLGIGIENWVNLEYFYISHAHFDEWPSSFDKLNKIAFFKLKDAYLKNLPQNLCLMTNLRAINIEQSFSSSNSISELPDCIINLDKLQSIIFSASKIESFPIGLFSMSSIEEIGFLFTPTIALQSFLDVINRTIHSNEYGNEFKWNPTSQTVYSFSFSWVCEEVYFGHYDVTNANFDIFEMFMNQTDGCQEVCRSFDFLSCTSFVWQNGVCNEECNVAACNFDGGDCNQLCWEYSSQCIIGLFDNGVCNSACNNSYCDFDKYECYQEDSEIIFANNTTYCDENIVIDVNVSRNYNISNGSTVNTDNSKLCRIQWVDDGWCDYNCFLSDSCYNDGNDCECNQLNDKTFDSNCETLMGWFAIFGDTTDEHLYHVSQYAFETIWLLLEAYGLDDVSEIWNSEDTWLDQAMLHLIVDYYDQEPNATIAFKKIDDNNDGYFDLQELLQNVAINDTRIALFNITYEKVQQINCTFAYSCYV